MSIKGSELTAQLAPRKVQLVGAPAGIGKLCRKVLQTSEALSITSPTHQRNRFLNQLLATSYGQSMAA
jgi:hypothetical protein